MKESLVKNKYKVKRIDTIEGTVVDVFGKYHGWDSWESFNSELMRKYDDFEVINHETVKCYKFVFKKIM